MTKQNNLPQKDWDVQSDNEKHRALGLDLSDKIVFIPRRPRIIEKRKTAEQYVNDLELDSKTTEPTKTSKLKKNVCTKLYKVSAFTKQKACFREARKYNATCFFSWPNPSSTKGTQYFGFCPDKAYFIEHREEIVKTLRGQGTIRSDTLLESLVDQNLTKAYNDYEYKVHIYSNADKKSLDDMIARHNHELRHLFADTLNKHIFELKNNKLTDNDIIFSDGHRILEENDKYTLVKVSHHLVCNFKKGLLFQNKMDMKELSMKMNESKTMKRIVKEVNDFITDIEEKNSFIGFDTCVYSKHRKFRIPGSKKKDSDLDCLVMQSGTTLIDHMISCTPDEYTKPIIVKSGTFYTPQAEAKRLPRKFGELPPDCDVKKGLFKLIKNTLNYTGLTIKYSKKYDSYGVNHNNHDRACFSCGEIHDSRGFWVKICDYTKVIARCYSKKMTDKKGNIIAEKSQTVKVDMEECEEVNYLDMIDEADGSDITTEELAESVKNAKSKTSEKKTEKKDVKKLKRLSKVVVLGYLSEDTVRYTIDAKRINTQFVMPCTVTDKIKGIPHNPGVMSTMFNPFEDNDVITACRDWLRNYKQKSMIIRSGLGTGKTELVKTIAKYCLTKNLRMLIVVCRQALARDYYGKFHDSLNAMSYLGDENGNGKTYDAQIQIICEDSIKRLLQGNDDLSKMQKYDIVIFDESESLLNHFPSTPHMTDAERIFNNEFRSVMDNATHILAMDGFISDRTYDFMSSLEKHKLKPVVIINEYRSPIVKTFSGSPDEIMWSKRIVDLINSGKNLVLPIMSNNKAVEMHKRLIDECGLVDFRDILLYHGGKDGERHTGKGGVYCSTTLSNVNVEWTKRRVIIYTPSIDGGVDYNVKNHFHSMHAWLCADSTNPDGFMQMCGRVRYLIIAFIYCSYSIKSLSPKENGLYLRFEEVMDLLIRTGKLFDGIELMYTTGDTSKQILMEVKGNDITRQVIDSKINRKLTPFQILECWAYMHHMNSKYGNFITVLKKRILEDELGKWDFTDKIEDPEEDGNDEKSPDYETGKEILHRKYLSAPFIKTEEEFIEILDRKEKKDMKLPQSTPFSLAKYRDEKYLSVDLKDKDSELVNAFVLKHVDKIRKRFDNYEQFIDPQNIDKRKRYDYIKKAYILKNRNEQKRINLHKMHKCTMELLRCFPGINEGTEVSDFYKPTFGFTSNDHDDIKKKLLATTYFKEHKSNELNACRKLFGFDPCAQPDPTKLKWVALLQLINQVLGHYCEGVGPIGNPIRTQVNGVRTREYKYGRSIWCADPTKKIAFALTFDIPELFAHKTECDIKYNPYNCKLYDSQNILLKIPRTLYWISLYTIPSKLESRRKEIQLSNYAITDEVTDN